MKRFLLAMPASVVAFFTSVILHNAIWGLWHVEEPVFFLIAVIAAPIAFIVGVVGSAVLLVRRLFART